MKNVLLVSERAVSKCRWSLNTGGLKGRFDCTFKPKARHLNFHPEFPLVGKICSRPGVINNTKLKLKLHYQYYGFVIHSTNMYPWPWTPLLLLYIALWPPITGIALLRQLQDTTGDICLWGVLDPT